MSDLAGRAGLFASDYRAFVEPFLIIPLDGEGRELRSARGRSVRLSNLDLEVARLFDGSRDAGAVLSAAKARLALLVDPRRLEGLVSDLACAGLMRPGRLDPLPVPPHTDGEARVLGWKDTPSTMADLPPNHAMPPSSVAGARNTPAYLGSVLGLVGLRGQPNQFVLRLPTLPFVGAGRVFLWPLAGRASILAFIGLFLACLFAVATHRHAWMLDGLVLVRGWGWIGPLVLALVLLNLAGASARAAALARYTPGEIPVGFVRAGPLRLPRVFVDTAGAAEQAARGARLRIIATGLVAPALLTIVAIVVWFCFHATAETLGGLAVAMASVGVVTLILRLNPLADYEGHHCLAHALGHPDLRTQGWGALYGAARPWPSARAELSRRTLVGFAWLTLAYIVLSLALMSVFLGDWLSQRFGGLGLLCFVGAIGLTMRERWRRADHSRDNLGRPKTPFKFTRRMGIAAGAAFALALIPYHTEPSGPFVVLPSARADVVAHCAGDIRTIAATEGQWVGAGDVIVAVDNAAARSALAAAQARVDGLASELALLKKGARPEEVAVARQQMATAQTRLQAAERDARRVAVAWRHGGATAVNRDLTRGEADVAHAEWMTARSRLALVASPARHERVAGLESDLQRAVIDRAERKRRLDETHIRAPVAGRVVAPRLQFARGRYLAAGSIVAQMEVTDPRIAEVEIRETDAQRLVPDGAGTVRAWSNAARGFSGRVVHVAPTAEARETGRIVRVQLEFSDPDARLKTGMTGMAKLDGGWEPVILVFTRILARYLFVRSWSWIP